MPSPAIVARPLFTPVLGTYAGDLRAGSNVQGFAATGQFKIVLTGYNAKTGVLTGTYYISKVVVQGKSAGPTTVHFKANAHFLASGGFDIHLPSSKGDVRLKGDYKRHDTFIIAILAGTAVSSASHTDQLDFAFDLSKRG